MHNDSPFPSRSQTRPGLTRRDFLWQSGGGLGGIALASMLGSEATRCRQAVPRHPALVYPAKGQARHPALHGRRGEPPRPLGFQARPDQVRTAKRATSASPWRRFKTGSAHGSSPCGISSRTASAASCSARPSRRSAPAWTTSRSSTTWSARSGVHSQATLLQATGFQLPGFPGAGCWVELRARLAE